MRNESSLIFFRISNYEIMPDSLKHFVGMWHIQVFSQFLFRKISFTTQVEEVTKCHRNEIKFKIKDTRLKGKCSFLGELENRQT